WPRDWSSDVCSSDLSACRALSRSTLPSAAAAPGSSRPTIVPHTPRMAALPENGTVARRYYSSAVRLPSAEVGVRRQGAQARVVRSEERRGGKEGKRP